MNQLWPRLASGTARGLLEELVERPNLPPVGATAHPLQTFAATGGSRVTKQVVHALSAAVREIARKYGYPDPAPPDDRIAFDREAAEKIYAAMEVTAFEASQPGVWTFLAVVAMPDITWWRFGYENRERWIASDLTRHMFARLWWQAFTFGRPTPGGGMDYQLLRSLSESDLNAVTERRSIAGNHRLAQAIAGELVLQETNRREVIRPLARKLRRLSAFVDFASLTDEVIVEIVRGALLEAAHDRPAESVIS